MQKRLHYAQVIQNLMIGMWCVFFIVLPVLFLSNFSDTITFPKQIFFAFVVLVSILLFAINAILRKQVKIFRSNLDLPVSIFIGVILLSSLFAVSRIDSITAFAPFLYLGLGYFILVNIVQTEKATFLLLASLVLGGCLVSILSFLTLFPLPFAFITSLYHSVSPIGTLIDQGVYLSMLFVSFLFFFPSIKTIFKEKKKIQEYLLLGSGALLFLGIITSSYQLFFRHQMPLVLPFSDGLQIAFATISQDSSRLLQSLFFGSGIGTFFIDFSRFKQATFNAYPQLWSLNISGSSTMFLELLSTIGVVGIISFLFLLKRVFHNYRKSLSNPAFLPLCVFVLFSFLVPLSLTTFSLFFFMITLFVIFKREADPRYGTASEFSLSMYTPRIFGEGDTSEFPHHIKQFMPVLFFIACFGLVTLLGFFTATYTFADMLFTSSLSAQNGINVYQKQLQAIQLFPYRDSFYRVFSQTNVSLAKSILTNTKDLETNQQAKTTAVNLVQQAVNSARNATQLAPYNTVDWQNLSTIYQTLIGATPNADQLAITTLQQAIALDSTNPREYIYLGGIYYQLKQYDKAAQAFVTAANLKPDLANTYYNLGLALKAQGNTQQALNSFRQAQSLVQTDKKALDQIDTEISALQEIPNETTPPVETAKPTPSPLQAALQKTGQEHVLSATTSATITPTR